MVDVHVAPRAGGGEAAVPARADPAADLHLEMAAGAFDALVLSVEDEMGERRPVHERGLLSVGRGVAALAAGRPADGRELPEMGIRVAGSAVALQRSVTNHSGEVGEVASRALRLLVRAREGVRGLALVVEAHLREGGHLVAVGAARPLDGRCLGIC